MKLLIILSSLILCNLASADSFTVIRDGKEYLCEQRGPIDPITSVECANKAYAGPFSSDEATRLCARARSLAPAECGIAAYAGPFSKDEAVELCIGARTNNGPIDCAKKAYAGPFSKTESVSLCSGNGSIANADCAIKANAGPYTKEEAIRICKDSPSLVLRSLNLILQSQELKQKVETIKNNLK